MKRADARFTHASVALAAGTGLLYGGLLYFGEVEDEFGPVQHAWVPTSQALHVVTAPLFVFALGLIWHYHVVQKLRSGARPRRRTGIALLSQALPMIASGYLLQVSVDELWRQIWVVAHVATSLLFVVAFVAHLLARATPGRA
ncbi:MAG: hypothetical protein KAI24_07360 [Planctomycetes bacterium]|nr:hypothetical protein [Planctomycetota bacterium]